MAVFFEKLKLEIKDVPQVHLTITDFVIGDHGKGIYSYQDFPHEVELIRDLIIEGLERNNIFLSKHYGVDGISIHELLNKDGLNDYYIEIPVGHIMYYNVSDLVTLSNKNKIIFEDLEEGDNSMFSWFDSNNIKHSGNFSKFLKESGINIDNVYFASPNFEKNRLCKEIKLHKMWLLIQSLCVPYVKDILKNNNKQKYLDILETKQYEKFAVFRNWRARKWRVVLLSLLHSNGMLDNIDWTLIGEYGHLKYDLKTIEFSRDHFLKYASEEWLNSSMFKLHVDRFFEDNMHQLPKFLLDTDTTYQFSHMHLEPFQIKRYKYAIDVESATLMSEKPIKAFLQGSMPIIVYPYANGKFIEKLKSFGFKMLEADFDGTSTVDDLVVNAAKTIKSLHDSKIEPKAEDIIHNFELCVDKHKLASYLIQPLIDTFK